MAFEDISGNSRVKKILQKALRKGRMPNSLLFSGPEGVGKGDTALVLAKSLNCEEREDDACEVCPSCKAISGGKFPDVMAISAEGEVIKIEQIRFLKQTAYLRPMVGKKRVFIVNEAERMTEEAANSFLKILEEPPNFAHIILVTHNPYLILPTIKSRCQVLSFSAVSREEMEKILLGKGYEKEQAKLIPLLVRGNLEQALSLEWEEVQSKRKQAWELFLSLLRKEEISGMVKNFTSAKKSLIKEELEEILEFFSSFCRDFVLTKEKGRPSYLLNPDYEEEIQQEEKLLSLDLLMDCLHQIDFALSALNKNLNVNLLVSSFFSNFMEGEYV
ncbi:MAG: DNA polymerase III subunit delta' [Candidatus Aminicenantes bacterium]|nr:DNA polymerase III subunit delta' [Candidatus Aminicenantes bacterium]